MRQVPYHYLLIGNGRLARHFSQYFSLLRLPFMTWYRPQPTSLLHEKLAHATHVILCIRDDAIEDFTATHLLQYDGVRLHCSGSQVSQHLIGAHPLMTFSESLYDLTHYQSMYFVLDEHAPTFASVLPGLPNPHVRLNTSLKPHYHALCVLACNFSTLLWQKIVSDFENAFHFPKAMIHPLLLQQMHNVISHPETALTGPLVRNDQQTLQKNIAALAGDPFQAVYQAFVTCYEQLTARKIA